MDTIFGGADYKYRSFLFCYNRHNLITHKRAITDKYAQEKASPSASLLSYSCLVTCKRNKARCNAASARSTSISGVGLAKRPSARSFAR